ncbi:MAG TPA: DUF5996 family protein [Candidatus Dormibacteraeota bacterium]|nr:DUF5996 family protein [Candidatus Dormibacteraeota bacterium]
MTKRDVTAWPDLPWHTWEPTLSTVHRWLQIVGRVRMVLTPREPHWAHVPLRVTRRGLTTGPIPHAAGAFRIDLDFVDHRLGVFRAGRRAFRMALGRISVARFASTLLGGLGDLGIDVTIPTEPAEGIGGPPLDQDEEHATYEPEHATAVWRGFVEADRLLRAFRRSSQGWTSTGLFWGSLDLAMSRYTEDPATAQTVGWWPTSQAIGPAFYAYTKPPPAGYRDAPVAPPGAFDGTFDEFILTWDAALATGDPSAAARGFFVSTASAGRPRSRRG